MSSTPSANSRISIEANRVVTGFLFGLALITYLTRAYIRARILKQFSIEDFLLLFAIICLIATTGLGFATLQDQYDAQNLQIILNNPNSDQLYELIDEIPNIDHDIRAAKTENAAGTLWWFVIFPVKLAYLFFFRRLIFRIYRLNVWWWFVVCFTIPAGFTCVAAAWLTCPYFTLEGVLSCVGPSTTYRTIRDTSITTAMDISTDLLVLSFPPLLLWRVRITPRQKLGLTISLCLSAAMIIVAIVRMAGIQLPGGTPDIVWLAFWQQQECSIAVTMVSASAFRSFFCAKDQNSGFARRRGQKSPRYITPTSYRKRYFKKASVDEDETELGHDNGLPTIPGATLQGMQTVIRESRMSRLWSSSGGMLRLGGDESEFASKTNISSNGRSIITSSSRTQVSTCEEMELKAYNPRRGDDTKEIRIDVDIEQIAEYRPRSPSPVRLARSISPIELALGSNRPLLGWQGTPPILELEGRPLNPE